MVQIWCPSRRVMEIQNLTPSARFQITVPLRGISRRRKKKDFPFLNLSDSLWRCAHFTFMPRRSSNPEHGKKRCFLAGRCTLLTGWQCCQFRNSHSHKGNKSRRSHPWQLGKGFAPRNAHHEGRWWFGFGRIARRVPNYAHPVGTVNGNAGFFALHSSEAQIFGGKWKQPNSGLAWRSFSKNGLKLRLLNTFFTHHLSMRKRKGITTFVLCFFLRDDGVLLPSEGGKSKK